MFTEIFKILSLSELSLFFDTFDSKELFLENSLFFKANPLYVFNLKNFLFILLISFLSSVKSFLISINDIWVFLLLSVFFESNVFNSDILVNILFWDGIFLILSETLKKL